MEVLNLLLVLFWLCAPAWLAAFVLNEHRKTRSPRALSFTWGYFVSVFSVLTGLFVVFLSYVGISSGEGGELLAEPLFWMIPVWLVSGYFAARRRKWAWVAVTIAILSPLPWTLIGGVALGVPLLGINYVYGRKRWAEFEEEAEQRRKGPIASDPVSQTPRDGP